MYNFIVNKEYNSVEEGDIYIQTLGDEYRKLFVVLGVDGEKVKLRRLSSGGGEFIRVNKTILSNRSEWKIATRFNLNIKEIM